MEPDVPNPPFPRAIPHAMAIIDLLHRVVFFGPFSGSLRVLPRPGSAGPSGDDSGGRLRALSRVLERKSHTKSMAISNVNRSPSSN